MNRPALVVLVRHAESVRNEAKKGTTYFADDEAREKMRGIPDHEIPLTPRGVEQARNTGIALRDRFGAFHYCYHSGYRRTVDTLQHILAAYPESDRSAMRIRQNMFIRERHPGYAYDMTNEEAEATFPWLNEYWRTFGGFFATPVGGESLADLTGDVYLFLNMLFRDRVGNKVLIVTHGGTIRCFRFLLEHWAYEQALKWPPGQSPKNCGVTVYQYDSRAERLTLQEYNAIYY